MAIQTLQTQEANSGKCQSARSYLLENLFLRTNFGFSTLNVDTMDVSWHRCTLARSTPVIAVAATRNARSALVYFITSNVVITILIATWHWQISFCHDIAIKLITPCLPFRDQL